MKPLQAIVSVIRDEKSRIPFRKRPKSPHKVRFGSNGEKIGSNELRNDELTLKEYGKYQD